MPLGDGSVRYGFRFQPCNQLLISLQHMHMI